MVPRKTDKNLLCKGQVGSHQKGRLQFFKRFACVPVMGWGVISHFSFLHILLSHINPDISFSFLISYSTFPSPLPLALTPSLPKEQSPSRDINQILHNKIHKDKAHILTSMLERLTLWEEKGPNRRQKNQLLPNSHH